MGMRAVRWIVTCDYGVKAGKGEKRCHAWEQEDTIPRLIRDHLEALGWQFYVRVDGRRARSGGGIYCPIHRR